MGRWLERVQARRSAVAVQGRYETEQAMDPRECSPLSATSPLRPPDDPNHIRHMPTRRSRTLLPSWRTLKRRAIWRMVCRRPCCIPRP
jgi:hypothetical protein